MYSAKKIEFSASTSRFIYKRSVLSRTLRQKTTYLALNSSAPQSLNPLIPYSLSNSTFQIPHSKFPFPPPSKRSDRNRSLALLRSVFSSNAHYLRQNGKVSAMQSITARTRFMLSVQCRARRAGRYPHLPGTPSSARLRSAPSDRRPRRAGCPNAASACKGGPDPDRCRRAGVRRI